MLDVTTGVVGFWACEVEKAERLGREVVTCFRVRTTRLKRKKHQQENNVDKELKTRRELTRFRSSRQPSHVCSCDLPVLDFWQGSLAAPRKHWIGLETNHHY